MIRIRYFVSGVALIAILSLAPMADRPNMTTWHDALQLMRQGRDDAGDRMAAKLPECSDAIEMPDEYDLTVDA